MERFSAALAQLQTPHLLARLGGDEFAVILYEADTYNAAMACGSALEESLAEPIELRDVVLHAQASIGIATSPEHGETRGDMLFAADAAMYSAKTSGLAAGLPLARRRWGTGASAWSWPRTSTPPWTGAS